MVVMYLKVNNFLAFDDFEINMSYPKKIVNSSISDECLVLRPNFRYKKLLILMGANATGKTAVGKVLMAIFNFITKKEHSHITGLIEDTAKAAEFIIDFAYSSGVLCRVHTIIDPKNGDEYEMNDIHVEVKKELIKKSDSYEMCLVRLLGEEKSGQESYISELEKVPGLTWMFKYPAISNEGYRTSKSDDPELFSKYLEEILKVLDPRIQAVVRVPDSTGAYVIKYPNRTVVYNDGELTPKGTLSSGTVEGIGVADMVTSMKMNTCDFYYCDEKLSHIHSDAEKAFLSLMIELLGNDRQLIFTSHNSDVLAMNLPKHSFAFLKRDDDNHISCTYASDHLKKSNESLKNAVENDLFQTAPDVSSIYALLGL